MAKSTQVKIKVTALDKASAVFRNVAASAKRVAVVGAAVGATVAAAGAAALKSWQAMTSIGDLAAKAGTTAEEIQRLSGAFGQLGIQGASIESVSQALAVMQKNTGGSGIDGFISALDKAKQAADPVKSLTESFGKIGLNLTPLLAGSSDSLRELIDLQFAASNGAVSSATKAANAWALFGDGAKAAWYDFAGKVAELLDKNIEGGVYAAAYKSVAYITAAIKSISGAFNAFIGYAKQVAAVVYAPFEAVGKGIAGVAAAISGGGMEAIRAMREDITSTSYGLFSSGFDQTQAGLASIGENFKAAAAEAAKAVEQASKLEQLKGTAAGTFTGVNTGAISGVSSAAARNTLIMGGSHASITASIRQQNEAVKTRNACEDGAKTLHDISNKLNFGVM